MGVYACLKVFMDTYGYLWMTINFRASIGIFLSPKADLESPENVCNHTCVIKNIVFTTEVRGLYRRQNPFLPPLCTLFNFMLKTTRREFLREILYRNIAVIAIRHSNINFFHPLCAHYSILCSKPHGENF